VVVSLLPLAFANFAAYFHSMRRYAVGLGKAALFTHVDWEPPGTRFLLLPLYAVAVVGSVLLITAASAGREKADPAPDHKEPAPAPGKPAPAEVDVTHNEVRSPQLPTIGAL
jgi:hypothetical protein